MQMYNGIRTNEGSFYIALRDCFYKASIKNRRKLVNAFPEFFEDSVPEFGIMNKNFTYKGCFCEWQEVDEVFFVYDPDQLRLNKFFRKKFVFETEEDCKRFIDGYWI